MEPINKKERRMSILSFLGVFLLTILPICIGVYLFARVDNVENRHLRALVKSQQSTAEESEEVGFTEKELSQQILELNKFLESKTEVISPNLHSEVVDKMSEIGSTSSKLYDQLESQDRKEYVSMIQQMKSSMNKFNAIYKMISENYEDAQNEIDDKEETIERQQKRLDELQYQ
jgi:methyl-accepting chemotaxis protein